MILRPLSNNTARVAALLSGDVDLIEDPPTTDLAKLKNDPKITLDRAVSNRVIYIHLDQHGEPPVGIPDTNGKNPLLDKRGARGAVHRHRPQGHRRQDHGRRRRAGRRPAALPDGRHGKDTPVDAYDPAEAKKLLAEAGYPNGFSITLGAPNGRYINDLKIAQAVASMWSRIGVKTEVDAAAPPVFFKNRDSFKYSAYMAGWGASTGELSNALKALLATPDRAKGMGTTNSRPLLQQGDGRQARGGAGHRRRRQARGAAGRGEQDRHQQDHGLIPIHFELSVWAMRRA